ncbi:hypothetical protein BGLT_06621 [Caballeronia glathei]|jgi:Zn-finger nucleic acid-binding protein|uniref:Transcription factor zinc-finger domain-containing protein n=1 Tax=Caballeronia glathei TaxID=60547 RepID=A0A069PCM1_9BURK|nr:MULTISPECIES: zf-TFIIB domain-containing protein [Burkholderiaceae]KDR38237.1 hypothetical protein BG61_02690 [Caballeronia glathei]TCK34993.1 hypothetical protein B0G84_6958 [Paraburkholderia sp. BL8N3]CDY77816.1 hypothetical protein BGLT_06621 [Caballeronia glathei]
MKCPVCKTPDLLMSDRQGIEIDYCGTCRGVWLDRGELDKLIQRAADETAAQSAPAQPAAAPAYRRDEARHDDRHDRHGDWGKPGYRHDYDHDRRYPRKKKSMLGELFDFD